MNVTTITSVSPCDTCTTKDTCQGICESLESLLPSMERGRVDVEDIPRILEGRITTQSILNATGTGLLTDSQEQVVQLYYREEKLQREIGQILNITQQGVNCHLKSVRDKVGKFLKPCSKFSA